MGKTSLFTTLFFLLLVTGCTTKNNGLPLPSSTKKISSDIIQVPFPYSESINGEKWDLNRDSSNHFVVQVSNNGRVEKTFPINSNSKESITLDGQKYNVSHITVNNDDKSGFVVLFKH
ncbi:hypothetical protein HPT25_26490 [Bacillus sp. BRMEA1]|uniref:hypothetical protein n=1 Tax=Neobacillus endophyticus TaxID=2738405 RepID=UPI00156505D2|nr:hypothetical protein [Neobacillus endophyticus]NRD80881.1 hypothetical protein [Neobacillus endophyticus]